MKTIARALVNRMIQPASVPGYITTWIAASNYDISAPMVQQLGLIGTGVVGALLVFLNTKILAD